MASQTIDVVNLPSSACMKSAKVGFLLNAKIRLSTGTAVSKLMAAGSKS
jgi:hypothetical protein